MTTSAVAEPNHSRAMPRALAWKFGGHALGQLRHAMAPSTAPRFARVGRSGVPRRQHPLPRWIVTPGWRASCPATFLRALARHAPVPAVMLLFHMGRGSGRCRSSGRGRPRRRLLLPRSAPPAPRRRGTSLRCGQSSPRLLPPAPHLPTCCRAVESLPLAVAGASNAIATLPSAAAGTHRRR